MLPSFIITKTPIINNKSNIIKKNNNNNNEKNNTIFFSEAANKCLNEDYNNYKYDNSPIISEDARSIYPFLLCLLVFIHVMKMIIIAILFTMNIKIDMRVV